MSLARSGKGDEGKALARVEDVHHFSVALEGLAGLPIRRVLVNIILKRFQIFLL